MTGSSIQVEAHSGTARYPVPPGGALLVLDGGSVFVVPAPSVAKLVGEAAQIDHAFDLLRPKPFDAWSSGLRALADSAAADARAVEARSRRGGGWIGA